MLYPENWQEYEWRVNSSPDACQLVLPDWRLWRLSVTVDSGSANPATIQFGGPDLGVEWTATIPVGEGRTFEPRGMFPTVILLTSVSTISWQAESIRRVPA